MEWPAHPPLEGGGGMTDNVIAYHLSRLEKPTEEENGLN